ncbi:MAG: DUF6588 family protein [Gemmatimonadota bacterium]
MRHAARRLLPLAVALPMLAPLASPAEGQDGGIEDEIRNLGADNGRLYARPVTSGLGAGLGGGWFHSARSLGPLTVEIGVRGIGAFVPAEDDVFEPVLPAEVTVDELGRTFSDPYGSGEGLETPTAAGDGSGVVVRPAGEFRQALLEAGRSPSDFALRFPRGFDLPAVPAGAIQLDVGVAPGVDVAGRFVPEIEIDSEVGSVQSLGGGVKLAVSEWVLLDPPVDLAVTAGIQSVDVGDYLSTDARHASLVVSRTFSALTLFASGTLEDSDSEVTYTVESDVLPSGGTTVSFEDDGANSGRFTTGFSLDLLFLQLKADYSASEYQTVSAGVGVRF